MRQSVRRVANAVGAAAVLAAVASFTACWRLAAAPYHPPPVPVAETSSSDVTSRGPLRSGTDAVPLPGHPGVSVVRGAHAYAQHNEGERFVNQETTPDKSLVDVLRWQLGRLRGGQRGAWRNWTPVRQSVPPRRVSSGVNVTWVNHATVLVQLDGVNLIIDPVYSDRVSPVGFAGPQRKHAPGVAFEQLPAIDVVVVSHSHYDHLDLATLKRLAQRDDPAVIVGLGNAAYLAARSVPGAMDVDWGDMVRVSLAGSADGDEADSAARNVVRITFVPARHWSARARSDRRRTLWGGYVVEGPSGRVYLGGDSGYGAHYADARARFGPFDVAILPIGAYRPEWFMASNHMSPADAVRAARDLGAPVSIPVHHSTFNLGDDGQDEPIAALRAALAASPGAPVFRILAPGEMWSTTRSALNSVP